MHDCLLRIPETHTSTVMQDAVLHGLISAAHTSYASMGRKEDLVCVVIVWADSKSHTYLHCNLRSGQDCLHVACCPAFAAMTARATHTVCQPATTQCSFGKKRKRKEKTTPFGVNLMRSPGCPGRFRDLIIGFIPIRKPATTHATTPHFSFIVLL